MDDTLHRYSSDTAMDADRDIKESKIAARAGKSIRKKKICNLEFIIL